MNLIRIKSYILKLIGKKSANGKSIFYISYVHNRKRFPNFKNPKDLSEIWIKRVLDKKVDEIYFLADKYAVRNYVKEKGLESILIPLIGVYNNAYKIDFETLPNKFALKANYGAGRNIICLDKSKLDIETTKKQVDEWLKPIDFSYSERHYNLIKKKFICEEFIDDGSKGFPIDYKFMCIKGKVHCILACYGRESGHADYLPYSVDWKPMFDYYRSYPKNIQILDKPRNLSNMIQIAEILAQNIDLVRVDLYTNGEKIWFGEMTLTPSGCIFHRWSNKAMDEMGRIYRSKN